MSALATLYSVASLRESTTIGAGKKPGVVHMIQYDVSKAKQVLGMKYRTMEETTRDSLVDFKQRGW